MAIDRELSPAHQLHSTLRDGSDDVIVERYSFDGEGQVAQVGLLRLNTANGLTQVVSAGAPDNARDWAVDRHGVPRAVISNDKGKSRVHITRPAGSTEAAPMVVLVHGGPWIQGEEWGWYADSQFLASRGYVVVEPEFRASTGFGSNDFRAGFKQWGLAMQDDVADAARWAVKQGYADARRICIAGASYGGYATLMCLIRDPDLYRCGVAWAGVTDIDLMYTINWSDLGNDYKSHGSATATNDRRVTE